jgi:hypothetical protein
MAPSYCKSATRFDVLEEVRLMVSLAHAVNELALLGLHPSVSAEPRVPEVKSAPVAGNRKQFILVTSSHRWRHRGEFPNFQVFLESQRAIVVSECEWTKANTRVHTTSTYLHLPQDLIVSYSHFIVPASLRKNTPSTMFKQALRPLVRGYATAAAQLNKEVNGFVGAVG